MSRSQCSRDLPRPPRGEGGGAQSSDSQHAPLIPAFSPLWGEKEHASANGMAPRESRPSGIGFTAGIVVRPSSSNSPRQKPPHPAPRRGLGFPGERPRRPCLGRSPSPLHPPPMLSLYP